MIKEVEADIQAQFRNLCISLYQATGAFNRKSFNQHGIRRASINLDIVPRLDGTIALLYTIHHGSPLNVPMLQPTRHATEHTWPSKKLFIENPDQVLKQNHENLKKTKKKFLSYKI
jgi:hypothetical protein